MRHAQRGPLLLLVAGVLLLSAVVAYVISEAEDQSRQEEATIQRQALDRESRRSVTEMNALLGASHQQRVDTAAIRDRQAEIFKSLKQIEALLEAAARPVPECERGDR